MALEIVFMWLGANVGCCFTRSDIELHFRYHWFNVHAVVANLNLIQYNSVCEKYMTWHSLFIVCFSDNIFK